MPDPQTKTIEVLESKKVYTGTNSKGAEYSIYEIKARSQDGAPITQKLTSFSDLPLGVSTYEVQRYPPEGEFKSFTLKVPKGGAISVQAFNDVVKRVVVLEGLVDRLSAPTTAAAAGVAQPPPARASFVDDPTDLPF